MVNALSEDSKTSGNVHAVVEMAMAAIPSLSQQQAEIATTILVEISPNVTPDIVQETVEIVANVEPGFKLSLFFLFLFLSSTLLSYCYSFILAY